MSPTPPSSYVITVCQCTRTNAPREHDCVTPETVMSCCLCNVSSGYFKSSHRQEWGVGTAAHMTSFVESCLSHWSDTGRNAPIRACKNPPWYIFYHWYVARFASILLSDTVFTYLFICFKRLDRRKCQVLDMGTSFHSFIVASSDQNALLYVPVDMLLLTWKKWYHCSNPERKSKSSGILSSSG